MISYPSYPSVPAVISGFDRNLGIGAIIDTIGSSPSSGAWPSANRAILTPFVLPDDATVVKLWVMNGATASGNIDVGVYDETFALKVSAGSTAQSGTNTMQVFDVTDTVLRRGRYYIAVAKNDTTGTTLAYQSGYGHLRAAGCVQMASAFALPSTVTPATISNTYIPTAGISLRTTL